MPIDMSLAAKAPPRKATGRASKVTVPVETQSLNERRTKGLMELAQLGQGIAVMFGQYADAAAIGRYFPPVAAELSNVADSSDVIAKPIDFLIEVGPYGALLAAALPLAMQVMANHRIIDASRLAGHGVVPPEVLEAQMQAEMARMQADAMKKQQQALNEARQAQAEYERMMAESQREFQAA